MPTLNTKLLLRLIAAVIVLGGGLFGLHRAQASRVPQALIWQANNAAERGKTDKAIAYMRQYLELRPDDHDAAIKLADMMLARATTFKDYSNAHFLYERVLRESPNRHDVGRKLVSLSLKLNRPADALIHAERLLQAYPTDGELLGQVAECQMLQSKTVEARATFERAITQSPDNVRAHELLARLLTRQFNLPREARAVLDRMVANSPNRPEAFLVRARFVQNEDPATCMKDLDRVFLLDPENAEALVTSAELWQARGDLRRARETLRDAVTLFPLDSRGYRSLAWLELLSGNQADARAALERGLTLVPGAPDLLTPLADIWVEQGELEKVDKAIKTLEARKDAGSRTNYLRGRTLMKQGKWAEALAVLDALRTEAVGQPALLSQLNLLIAGCHERRGDREAQVESLRRVLTADPNHLGARVALANAHLTAGRTDEAIKEYQLASRSPYAGVGVATTSMNLRIAVGEAQGNADWNAISAQLAKIKQQFPQAVEPTILLAESQAARGDFSAAEELIRAELARRPDDPRLWSALANCLSRGRGTLAAAEAVNEFQSAVGETIDVRLARARVWADDPQQGREARITRLEELPVAASDADRARLMQGLADLYGTMRNESGQVRVLTEIARRQSTDVTPRRQLFAIALKNGDVAMQDTWRAELRRLEGNDRTANILTALSTPRPSAKQAAEFTELARTTLAEAPDNIDAHLLAARLAETKGDAELATKHLEAAVALDVTSLRAQQARLSLSLRGQQAQQIKRTLTRLDADPRIQPARMRAIVEGAVAEAGPDTLATVLEAMASQIKRDPRTAVWAGQMLEAAGKFTEAMAMYRQCTQTQSHFADGWSAQLQVAAKLGDSQLNEVMTDAAKSLNRKAFYAVCAESGSVVRSRMPKWSPPVESADDQRAYAEACISTCRARGRLEDAIPVLRSLADNSEGRPQDVAWAKQHIAALTATFGDATAKKDALSELRNAAKPTTIEGSRTRANTLAMAIKSVSGDDRRAIVRELVELYSAVVADASATSADWYQLAQIYRLAGDRANSRKCLEELNRREPNNLLYVAIRVDDLLSDNDLKGAAKFVDRLLPGVADVRVCASAARYYTLCNEPAQALDVVERFVRSVDPGTADASARQRQAADLLDQLARVANTRNLSGAKQLVLGATERYRASQRMFPDAVTSLAALLAFDGQVGPAIDELMKSKSRLSPSTLALAGVAVIRSGHADLAQFDVVHEWLEAARKDQPRSLALLLGLGEWSALKRDFAGAEKAYRLVLQADPKSAVALNNLAWILACRSDAADQAMAFVDRAIALYGANGELLDTRARILISAGQHARAVSDLQDAINQSQTPLRYFHLALAQWKMDRKQEAIASFRDARARGLDSKLVHPDDLPAYQAMLEQAG